MSNSITEAKSKSSASAMLLTRKCFGLIFADSTTERAYHRWRDDHILFLLTQGCTKR